MSATGAQPDFDVDRFISLIESKPVLWDSRVAEYCNKTKKQKAWREVSTDLVENFGNLPGERQRAIGNDFQKKWRGIRSSFAREVLRQRNTKSGSGAEAGRRKYVFYDILSFLLPVTMTRSSTSNVEGDPCNTLEMEEGQLDNVAEQDVPNDRLQQSHDNSEEGGHHIKRRATPAAKGGKNTKTRNYEQESREKLCHVLTESLQRRDVMEDEDRHFCLSLVQDLKKVPPQYKLDVKLDIINAIKKYLVHPVTVPVPPAHPFTFTAPPPATYNCPGPSNLSPCTSVPLPYTAYERRFQPQATNETRPFFQYHNQSSIQASNQSIDSTLATSSPAQYSKKSPHNVTHHSPSSTICPQRAYEAPPLLEHQNQNSYLSPHQTTGSPLATSTPSQISENSSQSFINILEEDLEENSQFNEADSEDAAPVDDRNYMGECNRYIKTEVDVLDDSNQGCLQTADPASQSSNTVISWESTEPEIPIKPEPVWLQEDDAVVRNLKNELDCNPFFQTERESVEDNTTFAPGPTVKNMNINCNEELKDKSGMETGSTGGDKESVDECEETETSQVEKAEPSILEDCSESDTSPKLQKGNDDAQQSTSHDTLQAISNQVLPEDAEQTVMVPYCYKCDYCDRYFPKASDVARHVRYHTGEKPYKCQQCNQRFTESGNLTVHMRNHTGEKPYECPHCGKCFNKSNNLTVHIRTHSGEKPYKCEYCGKCFSKAGNFSRHVRYHTGEKPYKCNQCNRSFTESGTLAVHVRSHTGEKPYKCELCSKSFTSASHLVRHVRSHTGEKPYKCEQCSQCFTESGNFSVHMRTHTGEKPYQCKHCGKCFTKASNLTVHIRTHTGEKPYECEICGKCFSRSSDISRHVRYHTGEALQL